MRGLLLGAAVLGVPAADAAAGVVKEIVNNVPWWPESNLQFEEAVGVVSRGVLFATGMLEATPVPGSLHHFNTSQLTLELLDVRDIATAANVSLAALVDCVANVPAGSAPVATRTLEQALGGAANAPCLTVLETLGEDPEDYPGHVYNSSISCFASTVAAGGAAGLTHYHRGPAAEDHRHTTIRAVSQGNGMVWLAAAADGVDALADPVVWGKVEAALAHSADGASSGVGLADVVDCTVFVPEGTSAADVAAAQDAVAQRTSDSKVGGLAAVAAQLTVVQVGVGGERTLLRCTAIPDGGAQKRRHVTAASSVVVAGGFAYISGVGSAQANATDGFAEIGRALAGVGSRLDLVLNCMFFVSSEGVIDPFFHGFHNTFNRNADNRTAVGFPPPSRVEFVGRSATRSQCLQSSAGGRLLSVGEAPAESGCPVLSKCVAAMPA